MSMVGSMTKRTYKYRFYPTAEQASFLMRTFGCVRVVYNKALEERTRAWATERRTLDYADTSALLTQWKRTEEYKWLSEVSSVPLQQTLRHLQKAFMGFWAKRTGYPKYKSRRASRHSAEYTASAFRWRNGELTLAKMSDPLNIVWSRPLPEHAVPSTVTVSRDRAGRWHVCLLTATTVAPFPEARSAVGVDMGLRSFAVLSTGEKIANPRHTCKESARLARVRRDMARRQKGSANHEKTRLKVARIEARIADRRRDFLHNVSTRLIRENQTVVIEDLPTAAMSAAGGRHKAGLNRGIRDASWTEFRSMLEYKARWYGRNVVVIDRWFPSTQLCSACGTAAGRMPLNVRFWTCKCGATHDRDINAARNILAAGLAVAVCGDGRSLAHA